MMNGKALIGALAFLAQTAWAGIQTYKLYDEPHHPVTPGCDVFKRLIVDVDGGIGQVHVSNHVTGHCQLTVFPNERTYQVVLKGTPCGSKVYGTEEGALDTIEITDHHTRVCKDVVPAHVVVKEHRQGQGEHVYYTEH